MLANPTANLHTVHFRQHHIEQNEIKFFIENAIESESTVALGERVKTFVTEFELNEAGDANFIFDD